MLAIIATGVDDFSAFASVVATLNNLGPGLGVVADNFATMNPVAKWILIANMLFGRLKCSPLLVLFTPLSGANNRSARENFNSLLHRDGQTREIASFLASELKELGIDADTLNLNRTDVVEWHHYDRVVIGASIRYGHFHPAVDRL